MHKLHPPDTSSAAGLVRLLDATYCAPQVFRCPQGEVCYFSCRSPIKHTANEDAVAIRSGSSATLLAVADGCGGMGGGAQAAQILVETLLEATAGASIVSHLNMRPRILDGIEYANHRILSSTAGSATTLAAVEIRDEFFRCYHVGDSSVLTVGNRGKIKFQTLAHSPVAYGVEAGLISPEDALHHAELHLVSNVVGTRDMHIEVGPELRLAPRDTILIASDGLFDNLYVPEIAELIRKGPLHAAADELVARTVRRMEGTDADAPCKPDDLSFILFRRLRGASPSNATKAG